MGKKAPKGKYQGNIFFIQIKKYHFVNGWLLSRCVFDLKI
jgi:hypothetical protein